MDSYERNWRRVASSRTWSDIIQYNYWSHFNWRTDFEYQQRNAERMLKRTLLRQYANSMTPVKNWVGACWVSPSGDKYPVEFSNHWYRAYQIVGEILNIELPEDQSPDWYLSDRKGWARIGANGSVTDANWNSKEELSSEQFAVISEMAVLVSKGEAIWCQSGTPQDFLEHISDSLRFANERMAISA